jgi:hypothetical protein
VVLEGDRFGIPVKALRAAVVNGACNSLGHGYFSSACSSFMVETNASLRPIFL